MERVKVLRQHFARREENGGLSVQTVSASSGTRNRVSDGQRITMSYAEVGKNGARSLRAEVSEEEWQVRCDLAAAYRVAALNGWDDSINNHFTARVPGTHHFLINNMGEGFSEVTASSLVKIDVEGNVIQPGTNGDGVNRAGFIIHSALHMFREDAFSVMHTHQKDVTAVSCCSEGLLPITQTALLCGPISYHSFEGVVLSEGERETLRKDLQEDSGVMILRNHGVLTFGSSVSEAFARLYYAHKAAEIQVHVQSMKKPINPIEPQVIDLVHNSSAIGPQKDRRKQKAIRAYCDALFRQQTRLVDRLNPGYDI